MTNSNLNKLPVIDIDAGGEGNCFYFSLYKALKERDLDAAERAFSTATALRPDFAEALDSLGVIYFFKGRLEDAPQPFRDRSGRTHLTLPRRCRNRQVERGRSCRSPTSGELAGCDL